MGVSLYHDGLYGFRCLLERVDLGVSFFSHDLNSLNRIPIKELQLHRGIRQGDHFSPFMSTLLIGGLHMTAIEDVIHYSLYIVVLGGKQSYALFAPFYANDEIFID